MPTVLPQGHAVLPLGSAVLPLARQGPDEALLRKATSVRTARAVLPRALAVLSRALAVLPQGRVQLG